MSALPFVNFPASATISSFLRSLDGAEAAGILGVVTTDQLLFRLRTVAPLLGPGRTLVSDDTVGSSDYGTLVRLNGHSLAPGVTVTSVPLGVQGPGSVVTDNIGTVTLLDGEVAVVAGSSPGLLAQSVARRRNCIRTAGPDEPQDPQEGDDWFETSAKVNYTYTGGEWVPRPDTTGLTGFIHGNGTRFDFATSAATAGTANTLVLRGGEGQASFSATSVSAVSATLASGATLTDMAAVAGSTNAVGAYGVRGVHTGSGHGWGVSGYSANGSGGVLGRTLASGTGVQGESTSGPGGKFVSSGGSYHAYFGEASGDNRSAIERIRGWLVWFYNVLGVTKTGRLKTADITADREWTLPDQTGTVSLVGHSHVSADISDATSAATASRIVLRDGAGGFSSVSISLTGGSYSGTLTSATLTSARAWVMPDASGTVSLMGHTHVSANITDATASATANMVVRRNSSGGASFASITGTTLALNGGGASGGGSIILSNAGGGSPTQPAVKFTDTSTSSVGTLTVDSLTGTRSWILPDMSGTLLLSGSVSSADVSDATDGSTPDTLVLRNAGGGFDGTDVGADTLKLLNGEFRASLRSATLASDDVVWTIPASTGYLCLTGDPEGRPAVLYNGSISGTASISSTSWTFEAGADTALVKALGPALADPSYVLWRDDFFGGGQDNAQGFGELGWTWQPRVSTAGTSYRPTEGNGFGVAQLITNNVRRSSVLMSPDSSNNGIGGVLVEQMRSTGTTMQCRFKFSTLNCRVRVGLMLPVMTSSGSIALCRFFGLQYAPPSAAWSSGATIAAGQYVRPSTPNGRRYYATAGGTTGGTEPASWATAGGTTSDNDITWQEDGLDGHANFRLLRGLSNDETVWDNVDTTVAAAANTWYTMKLRWTTGTTWAVSIDGSSEKTTSDSVLAGYMLVPTCLIESNEDAAQTMSVDFFSLFSTITRP